MWVGSTGSLELHLASVMGVGVLVFHELVRGWLLTQAAIDEPESVRARILIPASLQGLPVGLLSAGLGLLLFGVNQQRKVWWLSILIASIAPAVASLSFVSLPVGLVETNLMQAFDPDAVNAKLYAVASGAMAVSGMWALAPAVVK